MLKRINNAEEFIDCCRWLRKHSFWLLSGRAGVTEAVACRLPKDAVATSVVPALVQLHADWIDDRTTEHKQYMDALYIVDHIEYPIYMSTYGIPIVPAQDGSYVEDKFAFHSHRDIAWEM